MALFTNYISHLLVQPYLLHLVCNVYLAPFFSYCWKVVCWIFFINSVLFLQTHQIPLFKLSQFDFFPVVISEVHFFPYYSSWQDSHENFPSLLLAHSLYFLHLENCLLGNHLFFMDSCFFMCLFLLYIYYFFFSYCFLMFVILFFP